jgi:hypothetical protein
MPDARICYRDLRAYKYQLLTDYVIVIPIRPETDIDRPYLRLTAAGELTIRGRYAWDGPSGLTIDTANFMRGSLVHDALYQLMREGALDYRVHRDAADQLLHDLCRTDGMSAIRAWYVLKAVRWFGEQHARPPSAPAADERRYAP